MASTALSVLWGRLADEIGPHQTMVTTTAAIGPDLGRWLISAEIRSDGAPPSYLGHFVYGASIGSFQVAHEEPGLAAIAVDQVISAGAVATSTAFETSWPLPVFAVTQGVTSLAALIQQACREVWYEDRIDLTPTSGVYDVSLAAQAAWLDSEARVLGLYDPSIDGSLSPHRADDRYGGLTLDGGSPVLRFKRAYLSTPSASHPAQLAVIRPAGSLVSGAESATGPAAAADTIGADPTEIVAVAKLKAYRYLATARHVSAEERQQYAALIDPQEMWVRANIRHYFPRDEAPQSTASGRAA